MSAETMPLSPDALARLQAELPRVGEAVVDAIVAEVPSYSRAFAGPMGATIQRAVTVALSGFLSRLGRRGGGAPRSAALSGAYDLGRGEARSGRSADALLAAYRVGARVAWRELSDTAVRQGLTADGVVVFADLVFAYIDELSAASVAGHSDEVESAGRARQRRREQVARLLLTEATPETVLAAAEQAEWTPPQTLTALLLPPAGVRGALARLGAAGAGTLVLSEDLPGVSLGEQSLLLVPDVRRPVAHRALAGQAGVLGPARSWLEVAASVRRALGIAGLVDASEELVDTEEHLRAVVLDADPGARADLRARVLAPLEGVRPASRQRLEETLLAWLAHQGRREAVAAALYVHPQTVRYRMGRLRELFGDRLEDPEQVLDLVVALADPR